jgi:hypothetical protein
MYYEVDPKTFELNTGCGSAGFDVYGEMDWWTSKPCWR